MALMKPSDVSVTLSLSSWLPVGAFLALPPPTRHARSITLYTTLPEIIPFDPTSRAVCALCSLCLSLLSLTLITCIQRAHVAQAEAYDAQMQYLIATLGQMQQSSASLTAMIGGLTSQAQTQTRAIPATPSMQPQSQTKPQSSPPQSAADFPQFQPEHGLQGRYTRRRSLHCVANDR